MMRLRSTLMLGAVLAFMACASAMAEEAPNTTLPFMNNGANTPVLQTISPDGQAFAPEAMTAPVAEDAAHEAGAGEHKKGLPQFDPTTFSKQLFWLFLTFGALFVVYSKVTLPRIGGMIEKRAKKVGDDLAMAEQMKADMEHIRAAYEAAIQAAQSEAQKLLANVQSDIKAMAEKQDAAFKARAEEAVSGVEKKIETSRTRIMADLNALAADLTVDIAASVAGVKTDAGAAQDVIDGLTGKARAA